MGQIYMVREVKPAVVVVVSNTVMMHNMGMSECIKEVLQELGCTLMWRLMRMQGSKDWTREAMHGGTLIAVTDGSYNRENY